MPTDYPQYPLPWKLLGALVLSALRREQRSFRDDAQKCLELLNKPGKGEFCLQGEENIPATGPYLVTINHYVRPGFRAWWLTLAVGAVIPAQMHWVVTAAWTYPDPLRKSTLTPLTRWAFQRMAQVYGFTPMPPMPPDPADTVLRARAVRQVLAYARQVQQPVIGLAPEGRDIPGSVLGQPPPGVGRFIIHLCSTGMHILPVGIYEEAGCLNLRFGIPYHLEIPSDLTTSQRDSFASQIVMSKIALLLPDYLSRGW